MNKFLLIAIVCMVCCLINLANVWLTGNGFSFLLGGVWLGASALMFVRYRKQQQSDNTEEKA